MEHTSFEYRCPDCNKSHSWSVTDHDHDNDCACNTAEVVCGLCGRTPEELE